jgi:hypothetical protein
MRITSKLSEGKEYDFEQESAGFDNFGTYQYVTSDDKVLFLKQLLNRERDNRAILATSSARDTEG